MTDYTRKHPNHECQPPEHPAQQPTPPKEGDPCEKPPETIPPTLVPPKPCLPPDSCCKCPTKPPEPPTCLEELIDKQKAEIAAAEKAKAFQSDLEKLQADANKALQAYTRETYDRLVADWKTEDANIAELTRKLVCAVPCWRCILDCYVCPLINQLHEAEKWLYDDGQHCTDMHDLYDLRYWHQRDQEVKERRFKRIKDVLTAWSNPAETIRAALSANEALINSSNQVIGAEPGKAIYDVFFRLVPLHLAIAPPAGDDTTTRIDEKFTDICKCDVGDPLYCCGIDVGDWSLRQRLTGPQPYLIKPNLYFDLICCLVKNLYAPAKDELSKAEANLADVESKITRYKALLDGLKDFGTNAKALIPSVIDCCEYEPDDDHSSRSSQSS
jgi:hypothetical protein